MHLVALRRDTHEKYPFAATSLYQAFCASKALAFKKMRYPSERCATCCPWMTADLDEIDEVFGGDPWPYGIESNRPRARGAGAISGRSIHDRRKPIRIDDLFVPAYGGA